MSKLLISAALVSLVVYLGEAGPINDLPEVRKGARNAFSNGMDLFEGGDKRNDETPSLPSSRQSIDDGSQIIEDEMIEKTVPSAVQSEESSMIMEDELVPTEPPSFEVNESHPIIEDKIVEPNEQIQVTESPVIEKNIMKPTESPKIQVDKSPIVKENIVEPARPKNELKINGSYKMSKLAEEDAIKLARESLTIFDDYDDMAQFVKEGMDNLYGKNWQAVVGIGYGLYSNANHFFFFQIGDVEFTLSHYNP